MDIYERFIPKALTIELLSKICHSGALFPVTTLYDEAMSKKRRKDDKHAFHHAACIANKSM
jgi:hypothetical protein